MTCGHKQKAKHKRKHNQFSSGLFESGLFESRICSQLGLFSDLFSSGSDGRWAAHGWGAAIMVVVVFALPIWAFGVQGCLRSMAAAGQMADGGG